jgi:hypothetical protein
MKTNLILIVCILLFSGTFATAQSTEKTSFAVLGGVNFQNLNGKDITGSSLDNDLNIGYHIGVNLQIPIAPEFYFQPGVMVSTKGAKNNGNLFTTTTKLTYVEVPLNLVYKGRLGNGFIMIGLGPYVANGVAGNVQIESDLLSSKEDIEFQNVIEVEDQILLPYYRALDVGGNIFFGYEMASGIFVQLNSQLGMLNINPEYKILPSDESITKNTGFGISLGYRF